MNFRLLWIAPLVLTAPLLAQQDNQPPQHHPKHPPASAQNQPDRARYSDQREQMDDERMDLDDLGLPEGEFWLNPEVVARISLTPDQVSRLADTHLQGTLKLIQLDADLQMAQARLEPMLAASSIDSNATLAQLDRIADAKAAIDKADARLAFGLRAILTPDQLMKLRMGPQDRRMHGRPYEPNDRPAPPQN